MMVQRMAINILARRSHLRKEMEIDEQEDEDEGEQEQEQTLVNNVVSKLVKMMVPEEASKEYAKTLVEEGFESEAAINTLTQEDLEGFSVKKGHIRLILKEIAAANGASTPIISTN